MLNLPKFINKLKVVLPNVYLFRILRIALPLLVVGLVTVIGLAAEFTRVVI